MEQHSARPSVNFDALAITWEHLAKELDGEFIRDADLDFALDFTRLPFADVFFKDMPQIMAAAPKINRPRISLVFKKWEIALLSTFPSNTGAPFLVIAQAKLKSEIPFHIRARKISVERSLRAWFQGSALGIAIKESSKAAFTKNPSWFFLLEEPVAASRIVRSGLPEFDSKFSIEATDEHIAERIFALLIPEPLSAITNSIKVMVLRSIPDSDDNCVFLYGYVDARSIDQSRQFLNFVEVTLDSLLSLGLISP